MIKTKIAERKKFNLLMSIHGEEIFHFKIKEENTNTGIFLEFMKELIIKVNEKNIKPYVNVLDNLKYHKTRELYDFYLNNKDNILFNPPYVSSFNDIEYSFRNLKNNY